MPKPVLPDLLAPGLRLVFCGTAPSRISMQARAYYANPQNRFWRTLHEVGLTPRRFAPADYAQLLPLGIGLTDLNKTEWGVDAELSVQGFDVAGFARKMRRVRPRAIAFTSKHAAQTALGRAVAYGLQEETIAGAAVFALSSPSGQARRYFQIAPWQALAGFALRDQH